MQASFARFYNEAEVSPLIQESWAYAFNDDSPSRGREAPYRYRRFSGGQDLPSGRYYSVCMNELGHDGGTLVAELKNYIDPEVSGPIHVCDSSDAFLLAQFLSFRQRNPTFYPHALAVTFFRRRNWSNPAFDQLKSMAGLRFGPFIAFSGP